MPRFPKGLPVIGYMVVSRKLVANIRMIDDVQSMCDCLDSLIHLSGYDVVLATGGKTLS